jgi:nucleoside-diphosphate-sugar epimerase
MRVLVTGHRGFIGAVMMPMLEKAGTDATGLDTGLFEECAFSPSSSKQEIRRDLRDVKPEDVEGFDAILHLAALSNDPLGAIRSELTHDINHKATIKLAKLAREASVSRFIFSSSCSNYGASGGEAMLTEEAAFNPVTAYGESKVNAEKDLLTLASDRFTPVLLRSATAYGVSPQLRCDIVLNNLTGHAVAEGQILIKSDGTPWRPIVHVEDICRAFIAVLGAPREKVHGQAFNVGRTTENYRVRELAEIVRDTVPNCQITYSPSASPDLRNYRVDSSKIAREVPGYQPQWNARDGARQLYEAFRDAKITAEDVEGWKYRRLGQIQRLMKDRLDENLRWKK